jgi:uncharacterized LabA/DUF88 family protein
LGCGAPSGALAISGDEMRTCIYVDGFNLYFGALKNTSHKWLDIKTLCKNLLQSHNQIIEIKYFTAHVSGTQHDPGKPIHQQLYIRALKHTTPEIKVILGQFTTHKVVKKLVTPINGIKRAEVYETTEKGSDVNLAVHLLNDAWLDMFDCAVVISGDSDLAESINLVKSYHKQKIVGVLSPGKRSMSKELIKSSDFIKAISTLALTQSQFPSTIPGTTITKPKDW